MNITHPSKHQLLLYLEGRLADADEPVVTDHLEWCPQCQDYLDALSPFGDSEAGDPAAAEVPARPESDPDGGAGRDTPSDVAIVPPAGVSAHPRVLGEYDLLEPLGAGGMGEVYRARHRRLGKLVAIKMLPVGRADAVHAAARFQREMQAVGQLDHPNLVEAHDAGECDGVFYLVLKLIEGTNLQALVRERGPLPAAEACKLIRWAALGLQHLHEHGLVHRDIKPANLMRTPDGQVKVLDLGMARWQEAAPAGPELTEMGQIMGTPDYMAPEQADNPSAADIRADLYSLGATFFYLLTGRAPFGHCKSRLDKLRAHAETPLDWRDAPPDVPTPVRAIVAKLLAKRPEERYATPQELADDLARVSGTTPPHQPQRRSPPIREHRFAAVGGFRRAFSRRWPRLLAAGLGVAVFGALLLGLVLKRPSQPEPRLSGTATGRNRPVEPLRVRALEVRHTDPVAPERNRGIFGKLDESFGARLGDAITVKARLSRPAYCYLIVFRPDEKSEVIYPLGADNVPELTDEPRYPSKDQTREYGLEEGTGLWMVALVASESLLPAYSEWRRQHPDCPWAKSDGEPDVVRVYDGQWLDVLTPGGGRNRGEREAPGAVPIMRVVEWLKAETGGTVAAVAFTVEAKK